MPLIRGALLIGLLALGACVPKREAPTPSPQPQPPVAQPRPQPPIAPPPAPADWRDRALTPGNWVYSGAASGSQAQYGPAGSEALFIVRCDRARRQVSLGREGSGGAITVRTSADARSLPVSVRSEPAPYSWAALSASDRILDAMVFSRGRFTVEAAGQPVLVIPAWPEPARVVEDCRG